MNNFLFLNQLIFKSNIYLTNIPDIYIYSSTFLINDFRMLKGASNDRHNN